METTSSSQISDMEQYFKEEYGKPDLNLREYLYQRIGRGFQEHAEQVINFGITKVNNIFLPNEIVSMQHDVQTWVKTKKWDKDNHIGFDGNSGEQYLPKSEALSKAVTHPAIFNLVTAVMGQYPKMNFVRTVCTNPIEPYERRAFQWHHDGYSEIGLRVMLLLTDVPDFGQAMKYLPGTNVQNWDTHSSRETRFNNEFVQAHREYICSGKAGDIFVFTNHGAHRGQRNNTVRRDIMLINFQPGLARNYPLPGIAPAVIGQMSQYEKEIFGVGKENPTGVVTNIKSANREWRAMMKELFKTYVLPVDTLNRTFQGADLDTTIDIAGKENLNVDPDVYPFVDFRTPEQLAEVETELQQRLNVITYDDIKSLLSDEEYLRTTVFRDMHGDLDLPIRMYHPNLDQRRDSAITQTRDGRGEIVANEVIERVGTLSAEELRSYQNIQYHALPSQLLESTKGINNVPVEDKHAISVDSFLCFTNDLVDMMERVYTEEVARRNTLYTYMASRFFELEFGNDERLPQVDRNKMKEVTRRALVTYAKFLAANQK